MTPGRDGDKEDTSEAPESSTARFWMEEIDVEEEKPVVEADDKPRADDAGESRWAREKRRWREPVDAGDSGIEEPVAERKEEADEEPAVEREDEADVEPAAEPKEDDTAFGEGIL